VYVGLYAYMYMYVYVYIVKLHVFLRLPVCCHCLPWYTMRTTAVHM